MTYAEQLATFELHAAALQARLAASRLFDNDAKLHNLRTQLAATTKTIAVAGHATLSACRHSAELFPVRR